MPVTCAIRFPRLSGIEMREIDYRVMRHAFDVQRELGCLCDEVVYHNQFFASLRASRFQVEFEVPIQLSFRSFLKPPFMDIVVNESVIYELKSVANLTPAHTNQLLSYLLLTNSTRGKLINFRPSSVQSKFVNSSLDMSDRRNFSMNLDTWTGPDEFGDMIVELVSDWGTGLDQSLYTEAVVHELGGPDTVVKQLPMALRGVPLGNQRFRLLNDQAAFRLTTFPHPGIEAYESSIRKLLLPSPLSCLHWVNICHHEILFRSITR